MRAPPPAFVLALELRMSAAFRNGWEINSICGVSYAKRTSQHPRVKFCGDSHAALPPSRCGSFSPTGVGTAEPSGCIRDCATSQVQTAHCRRSSPPPRAGSCSQLRSESEARADPPPSGNQLAEVQVSNTSAARGEGSPFPSRQAKETRDSHLVCSLCPGKLSRVLAPTRF